MDSCAQRIAQFRFKPLWLYVDGVREFCDFFTRATFEDPAVGERVGLVTHELIENAIRHGDERELDLALERTDGAVVITVANTTSDESALKLARLFAELTDLPPDESYARAMVRAARSPQGESGLGLPRIRSEACFELMLEVTPGRVSITARGNL